MEGIHAVRELLVAGRRRVHEVLVAPGEGDRLGPAVADIVELAASQRVPVRTVARSKLAAAARTDAPQGVLARAAPLPEAALDDLTRLSAGGPAPFLVALDGVTDPGNLGAVLRSADGAGATGVVLPRHRAVHVTPAVTKAAAGAVEYLPMAVVGGLPNALGSLAAAGVWLVGLASDGETTIDRLAVADGPVCLVLGAEGTGLSRLVRRRCDVLAAIPQRGHLSSLNVAAAATIACYEIARARA